MQCSMLQCRMLEAVWLLLADVAACVTPDNAETRMGVLKTAYVELIWC
jgi:hypothetical protein